MATASAPATGTPAAWQAEKTPESSRCSAAASDASRRAPSSVEVMPGGTATAWAGKGRALGGKGGLRVLHQEPLHHQNGEIMAPTGAILGPRRFEDPFMEDHFDQQVLFCLRVAGTDAQPLPERIVELEEELRIGEPFLAKQGEEAIFLEDPDQSGL